MSALQAGRACRELCCKDKRLTNRRLIYFTPYIQLPLVIKLIISPTIRAKLQDKHCVQGREIEECFLEHDGVYLRDTREDNTTDPPTLWFIASTYRGRRLKVVFVSNNGNIYVKTAYEPNDVEKRIYDKLSRKDEGV